MHRFVAVPIAASMLAVLTTPDRARAQETPSTAVSAPKAPFYLRKLRVVGNERISTETIRRAVCLREGQSVRDEVLNDVSQKLVATGNFVDVRLEFPEPGSIVIRVHEEPIIRKITYEGNLALRQDRISANSYLEVGDLLNKNRIRHQVTHLIDLYRQLGRFATSINPMQKKLSDNGIELIFEINENVGSVIRQINIIGNDSITDQEIRGILKSKVESLRYMGSESTHYSPNLMAQD